MNKPDVSKMGGQTYKEYLKERFFDKEYSKKYDKWTETDFSAYVEKRQKLGFLELTEAKPGYNVIDVGAGTGKYEVLYNEIMKGRGKITACDFSDSMLEKLKQNMLQNGIKIVEMAKGDAEKLPFPDNSFDEFLSMNTLQYVPNDKKFFSEAYRVLKPGRVAVIDALSIAELRLGHNLTASWDNIRRVFGKNGLGIYKQMYTFGKLEKKLKANGFVVEKKLGVILSLPWITREHVGVTLPSPQHMVLAFPKLFRFMEKVEDSIKDKAVINCLCTHLMVKARKIG